MSASPEEATAVTIPTEKTFSVARATNADFLDLAACDRAVWASYPNGQNIPDGEHTWSLWCRGALTIIARSTDAEGSCIGGAVAFPNVGGPLVLHKVFVAEASRGGGVGTALCQAVCKELDRLSAVCFLTVNPLNERAIATYTKFGFGGDSGSSEFVKGYYRENEDRLVLTRRPRQ